MSKVKVLILSGLVIFMIAAGGLYYISVPVMNLSTFKHNTDAQQSINGIVWVVVFGGAAIITAGFLRLIYEIFFGRHRNKRQP